MRGHLFAIVLMGMTLLLAGAVIQAQDAEQPPRVETRERVVSVRVHQIAGDHVRQLHGDRLDAATVDRGRKDTVTAKALHGLSDDGAGLDLVSVRHKVRPREIRSQHPTRMPQETNVNVTHGIHHDQRLRDAPKRCVLVPMSTLDVLHVR